MVEQLVAVVGFAAAAAAAAWPYMPKRLPAGPVEPEPPSLPPSGRARWVNDLFVLAGQADKIGEHGIAAAARSLISALVAEKELTKRGR